MQELRVRTRFRMPTGMVCSPNYPHHDVDDGRPGPHASNFPARKYLEEARDALVPVRDEALRILLPD